MKKQFEFFHCLLTAAQQKTINVSALQQTLGGVVQSPQVVTATVSPAAPKPNITIVTSAGKFKSFSHLGIKFVETSETFSLTGKDVHIIFQWQFNPLPHNAAFCRTKDI